MKHTEQLRNLVTGHSTAKLLEPRAMGKFYTHPLIATWLAEHIIASLSPERITSLRDIYILDPFCGDGRLLAILLEQLDRLEWGRQPRWHVEFWDYDESAVQAAYTNLSSRIKEMALEIVLKPAIHDSLFVENGFYNKYEVVVTNPLGKQSSQIAANYLLCQPKNKPPILRRSDNMMSAWPKRTPILSQQRNLLDGGLISPGVVWSFP